MGLTDILEGRFEAERANHARLKAQEAQRKALETEQARRQEINARHQNQVQRASKLTSFARHRHPEDKEWAGMRYRTYFSEWVNVRDEQGGTLQARITKILNVYYDSDDIDYARETSTAFNRAGIDLRLTDATQSVAVEQEEVIRFLGSRVSINEHGLPKYIEPNTPDWVEADQILEKLEASLLSEPAVS